MIRGSGKSSTWCRDPILYDEMKDIEYLVATRGVILAVGYSLRKFLVEPGYLNRETRYCLAILVHVVHFGGRKNGPSKFIIGLFVFS